MHIAHVMEATIGGTRRHLVDVAFAQLRRGDEVSLLVSTLRDPGFEADLRGLEQEGAHVRRIPMVRSIRPAKDLRHLRQVKSALRELRPDVVHTHSSKGGVLGRRASLSTGIGARVHTPHTFAFLFGALFGRAKRAVFRSIERSLASSTHRLIAVSASEAQTIEASGIVEGDLRAPRLLVKEGAVMNGSVEMTGASKSLDGDKSSAARSDAGSSASTTSTTSTSTSSTAAPRSQASAD